MRYRIVFCLVSALFTASLLAQEHPNLAKGFNPEKAYQVGDIDDIDLFSGNVIHTLPIGQTYPVASGFSYSFKLVHNNRPWLHYTDRECGDDACVYSWEVVVSIPDNVASNAGLGWLFSLGRLFSPGSNGVNGGHWVYESPDGADHLFYDTLHIDETADHNHSVAPVSGTYYTRDNSYLRLRVDVTTGFGIVEFPDGLQREFTYNGDTEWQLTRIQDRQLDESGNHTNWLTVSHPASSTQCTGNTTEVWSLRDSRGRSHTACFKDSKYDTRHKPALSEIILSAFGGKQARYTFQETPSQIFRDRFDNASNSLMVDVPLLTRVTLPDNTAYDLSYDQNNIIGGGLVKSIVVPAGGRYEYGYGTLMLIDDGACTLFPDYVRWVDGIGSKREFDRNGKLLAQWSYDRARSPLGVRGPCPTKQFPENYGDIPADEMRVSVITPANKKIVHYFSVWPGIEASGSDADSANGFKVREYGLPLTRTASKMRDGMPLSVEYYDCADAQNNNCPVAPTRSVYVTYDRDASLAENESDSNRRLTSTRTVYFDDGETFTHTGYSDFDGLGHYRKADASGFTSADPVRSTTTNFNPRVGSFPNSFTMLRPIDPWALNTYDSWSVAENGKTEKKEYDFDSQTGSLNGVRALKNAARGGDDLLTILDLDDRGNAVREKSYGGDGAGLDTTSCCARPGSTPVYLVRNTYSSAGVLSKSEYVDPDHCPNVDTCASVLTTADYTMVDAATGLVRESRDSAGVPTTLEYDTLARPTTMTTVTSGGTITTNYDYTPPTSSTNAVATETLIGTAGRILQQSRYELDGFSRVKRASRSLSNGKIAATQTDYDEMGRKARVSQPVELNSYPTSDLSGFWTRFRYDLFDRPILITAADDTATTFGYKGVRQTTRTSSVATSISGAATDAATTEVYDAQGRLISVQENSAGTSADQPKGAPTTTTYTYDVGARLVTVKTASQAARSFDYDGRGLLRSENHPENGETSYGEYDARGHARTRTAAGTTLRFDFDRAERLTAVRRADGQPIKEFEFATDNNGTDLRKGKLVKAVRHNELSSAGKIDVSEAYEYRTSSGQMSQKTTLVEQVDGATRRNIQTFTYGIDEYDDFQLPRKITMPICSVGVCSAQTTSNGIPAVTNDRKAGYLESVNGFGTLAYHPTGMVASVTHTTANQPSDVYDARNGMARPSKITFTGCSNITPYFLPGSVVVKANPSACGLQITWPPAVWCGFASDVKYTVVRDGTPVPGASCLTGTTYTDTTAIKGTPYQYSIVAEGPPSGASGSCQAGQTVQLVAPATAVLKSCANDSTLTTSDVVVPVGIPYTFQATLGSSNGPVPDEQLLFNILGKQLTARTGSNGVASVTYAVDIDPGVKSDAIIVTYAGGLLPPATATASLRAVCSESSYSINPKTFNVQSRGGVFNALIGTSSRCAWSPVPDSKWTPDAGEPPLTASPMAQQKGQGTFTINVPISSAAPRSAKVEVGQQFVNVQQSGTCSYQFAPEPSYLPADTSSLPSSIAISAPAGCSWTVTADSSWIHILQTSVESAPLTQCNPCQGPGTVTFRLDPNFGNARTATLAIDSGTAHARAHVNQAAAPPVTCPALIQDLIGDGTIDHQQQNISLRAYATGTQVVYDWYINDQQCQSCTHDGALTILPGDGGYPAPGHTNTYQVAIHVNNSVQNSCGVIASKKVSWTNNAPSTNPPCNVPLLGNNFCPAFGTNAWPGDALSPFPGTTIGIPVIVCDSSTNLHYQWYFGPAGNRDAKVPNGTDGTVFVSPTSTRLLWIEVTNDCGSQQSRTAVVVVTPPPVRPHPCCIRFSFTGSGHDDIPWHNRVTGANEVWAMSGTVHTATYALPPSDNLSAQLQSAGDLNADGKPDLIWRDPTIGNNSVWLMNFLTLSSVSQLESRPAPNWTIGAVADLSGEGKDDIVWHNEVSGENEIWFQNGTSHAGTWALPSNSGGAWGLHGAGDFNGDGKLDLFFHNRTTGQNEIWNIGDAQVIGVSSNSAGSTAAAVKPKLHVSTLAVDPMPDTNWVPALIADLNGDSSADVVWRNVVTGENMVWIMSGATHVDTVALEPRTDQAWQIGGGGSTNTSTSGGGATGTPTSLHVTANPAAIATAAAVTAILTASNAPIAQRPLAFLLNGNEIARLLTDDSGTATAAMSVAGIGAGTYTGAISVRFDGDGTYGASTASADLVVSGTQPLLTWNDPAPIVYGTPLGNAQLNATANVAGAFVYSPPAGTILDAGYQTLSVTFTPADSTMAATTSTALIVVSKAPSSISWPVPSAIAYGTPLSALQLNATSALTGAFTYNPQSGTVLPVGNAQTLTVTFVPDSQNFGAASATTFIDVGKGSQIIRWSDPAPMSVLQPLGNVQLNASVIPSGSAPAGQATYDPPLGAILGAGMHELRVTVAETPYYESASASVDLLVSRATPIVQWTQPASIVYGTALSATQLNATVDVPGTFTYMPAAGTILDAGTQQLSAVFAPSDDRYDTVTVTATIEVLKAKQTITWSNPAPITFGTPLTATQLNAQVQAGGRSPAGSLVYSVALGAVLQAGQQTLTVTSLATQNYDAATASVTIDVLKAAPVVTWSPPTSIIYGTALSATQLNAAASVAGTFAYTPGAGAILNAGSGQTLQVVFTPTDARNYTTTSQSVLLTVTKANQTITWPVPADIVYGTQLSSTQLNASVSVVGPAPAGTLTYTPPAGTLLQAGSGQSLTVAVTETSNYNPATATVLLTVQKAKPVVTWAKPAGIVYGTALSATQLAAAADVPGSFVYIPGAGTILDAGAGQTLAVTFTPTDTHNFENGSATVAVDVAKARQSLSWSAPVPIVYGTRLGSSQLNATVNVVGPAAAGTLVYAPPSGTALDVGKGQTLSVTARETENYEPATISVTIDVTPAPLTLRVDPQSKLYGTALPALTGTLTGVVNGDPIIPQYSTTATIASVVGTYPITGQLVDPSGRLRNYEVTITPATLTVLKAPLFVTADDVSKQYSDPLPQLTASFRGFVLGETPAVLGGVLAFQTTVTSDTAPGRYPITASGLGSPNYDITFLAGTLTVTPEDASVAFLAPLTVAASPVTGNATVTLASLVTDAHDSSSGDIRNATLTFIDRTTGRTLCIAAVGLVAASDTTTAVASCTFTATVGAYTVESRVGGWYTRDATADDVTLSVAKANDDFVTGGAWANLSGSAGAKAADVNSRADFNLNPQYDNSGAVKGALTVTFRRTEGGAIHEYRIDSGVIDSLAIVRTNAGGVAAVTGTATLTDITTPQAAVVVSDKATLIALFTDSGEPANDAVAVTLLAKDGGLLFSSKWDGARTVDQTIAGGSIEVHLKQ